MDDTAYTPRPIDTSGVVLPEELLPLLERLAENTHDVWARSRLAEGWTLGHERDAREKVTPCLVPYQQLPESEKEYDRRTSSEALKAIIALGFRIVPARCAGDEPHGP